MNKKDIMPTNEKGSFHGYCKRYHDNGKTWWEGMLAFGRCCGYHKDYCEEGIVMEEFTGYFLDDKKISVDNEEGYCYIWDRSEL